VFPRLSFSDNHVELPTVPLDVTSRAEFRVLNNGYQSLALKYKVSPAIMVPLEISFPDGQEIGMSRDSVRVVVSCVCNAPISWSGTIEFQDEDGERFSVELSGCADNSILTCYNFVKNYAHNYGFLGLDNQPVNYILKKYIQEMRAADAKRKELLRKQRSAARSGKELEGGPSIESESSGKSKGGGKKKKEDGHSELAGMPSAGRSSEEGEGVDIGVSRSSREHFNDAEARFVLKWLNRNAMANPFDEERFPECILESHGDLVVNCIEQLSGKKVPGMTAGVPAEAPPPSRMGSAPPGASKPPAPPSSEQMNNPAVRLHSAC
jgi:hypothetical protein